MVGLTCACALPGNAAYAQPVDAYPAKPVRVIVGLAPGGGTDIIARLLSQKISDNLKRSFIVENRTGAGGTVAYALVAKSAPDGYTLLAVASGYAITPAVYPKLRKPPPGTAGSRRQACHRNWSQNSTPNSRAQCARATSWTNWGMTAASRSRVRPISLKITLPLKLRVGARWCAPGGIRAE